MSIEILDPTCESISTVPALAPRLATLTGTRIGIISNGKYGTEVFFDAFERELRTSWGVASVDRRTKNNFSAPADAELMDEVSRWQAVVAGVGD